MSDTARRTPSKATRVAGFLLADAVAMTFLLAAFASTEDCTGITSVSTSVTYNSAPFRNTVVKTVRNVSGATRRTDQKFAIKVPNAVTVSGLSATDGVGSPIPITDCPPAVRELNTLFPPGVGERWVAMQIPIVSLDPGQSVRLQYLLGNVTAPGIAVERAAKLDADFSCPQAYVNSFALTQPTDPGPALPVWARIALLAALAAAGGALVFRRTLHA